MTIKIIVNKIILGIAMAAGVLIFFAPAPLLAQSSEGYPTSFGSLFQGSADEACKGASASESASCSESGNKINNVLQAAINIFSVIVGIITVIMFILGGFRYITSGGDPANIAKAKNSLIYAAVGLVLVALSQALVQFVFAKASK